MRTREQLVKRLEPLLELQEEVKQMKRAEQLEVSKVRLFSRLVKQHQKRFNDLSKVQNRLRVAFNEVLTELKPY